MKRNQFKIIELLIWMFQSPQLPCSRDFTCFVITLVRNENWWILGSKLKGHKFHEVNEMCQIVWIFTLWIFECLILHTAIDNSFFYWEWCTAIDHHLHTFRHKMPLTGKLHGSHFCDWFLLKKSENKLQITLLVIRGLETIFSGAFCILYVWAWSCFRLSGAFG